MCGENLVCVEKTAIWNIRSLNPFEQELKVVTAPIPKCDGIVCLHWYEAAIIRSTVNNISTGMIPEGTY